MFFLTNCSGVEHLDSIDIINRAVLSTAEIVILMDTSVKINAVNFKMMVNVKYLDVSHTENCLKFPHPEVVIVQDCTVTPETAETTSIATVETTTVSTVETTVLSTPIKWILVTVHEDPQPEIDDDDSVFTSTQPDLNISSTSQALPPPPRPELDIQLEMVVGTTLSFVLTTMLTVVTAFCCRRFCCNVKVKVEGHEMEALTPKSAAVQPSGKSKDSPPATMEVENLSQGSDELYNQDQYKDTKKRKHGKGKKWY